MFKRVDYRSCNRGLGLREAELIGVIEGEIQVEVRVFEVWRIFWLIGEGEPRFERW